MKGSTKGQGAQMNYFMIVYAESLWIGVHPHVENLVSLNQAKRYLEVASDLFFSRGDSRCGYMYLKESDEWHNRLYSSI